MATKLGDRPGFHARYDHEDVAWVQIRMNDTMPVQLRYRARYANDHVFRRGY